MRHLKLSRVLTHLLAGMVLTIAVAWSCQLLAPSACVDVYYRPDARLTRPARVNGTWIAARIGQISRGFGRTTYWFRQTNDGDVGLWQSGWPMRALEFQTGTGWRSVGSAKATEGYRWAFAIPASRGLPSWLTEKLIPLRIIGSGFAINSLFFALLLVPALAFLRLIRGRVRILRHRCPACGYPTGVSDRCTECGHSLPTTHPAPSQDLPPSAT